MVKIKISPNTFLKTLIGEDVIVEMKNNIRICGCLETVDNFTNVKLGNIRICEPKKYPHLVSLECCFIRGSVIRYIQLEESAIKRIEETNNKDTK